MVAEVKSEPLLSLSATGNSLRPFYNWPRVQLKTKSCLVFRKFAEAVARKLMFAQQALKEQNCNFASFENSGEDLINEVSRLPLSTAVLLSRDGQGGALIMITICIA